MARLDREALTNAIVAAVGATPDPENQADLVGPQGRINVAASGAEIGPAIKRLTPLPGYRWVAINAGDPVSTGLVDSLARPGGHLTGISDVSADLTPKRLELLTQLAPGLRRVAMLWNAADLGMTLRYQASETGAQALGLRVQPLGVRGDRLMTQIIELTIYALTLLGPSEGVPTSLRSARSTPTAHRGNALCACRLGKVDNSSKVA